MQHTMKTIIIGLASLLGTFSTQAAYISPLLIDSSLPEIYFSESYSDGIGRYTVTNNVAGSQLLGFGVTNHFTYAHIEDTRRPGILTQLGSGELDGVSWNYEAKTIRAHNWAEEQLFYRAVRGTSAQDLLGDIDSILDEDTENTLNWYGATTWKHAIDPDAGLLGLPGGVSWDGFVFTDGIPASLLYGVILNADGSIFITQGVAPMGDVAIQVSEPGILTLLLLGSGLLLRRRI
ncbi:PEP-CTERM sorting domain-containing protein [Salinimonas sediminis]|uniref:PEP-CTERM sorting domain-containing protein n=2 Tax=Salinimonas sediminis TaxID=2303538 RepID=A0A346NIQ0_9ALTE|nr:PEP-CTERM sorting domain-containing protein [Salinimonas sediminis]